MVEHRPHRRRPAAEVIAFGRVCPAWAEPPFVRPPPAGARCRACGSSGAKVARVARSVLERTLQTLSGIESTVHEVTLVGNPAMEIVEFATNLGVGLFVAGTRGRSPEKELYLGSVSNALTHRAPCSILIVG